MSQTYESKILDHLGLVAGMYDELEIGKEIDSRIAQDTEQRKVSVGKIVKAMILNGLGFIEQRLYLTTQFFETLPTERLLGSGIRPEHLNDDVLGRTLDSLYEYGVTELFRDLAAHSTERLGLTPRFAHLDATSFHVDGEYNSGEDEPEEGVIHVRQGYSRDRRPGLNQIVLDLIVEHQAEAKAFSKITWREFACREDAEKALEAFEADLKASTLSEKRVSRGTHYVLESQSTESQEFEESGECWFVGGSLIPSEAYEAQLLKRRSLFILTTNELDKKRLSAKEILQGYKGQVRVERGFRFLKDPLFLASAFNFKARGESWRS